MRSESYSYKSDIKGLLADIRRWKTLPASDREMFADSLRAELATLIQDITEHHPDGNMPEDVRELYRIAMETLDAMPKSVELSSEFLQLVKGRLRLCLQSARDDDEGVGGVLVA